MIVFMPPVDDASVTELLSGADRGDPAAASALYARLYPEIKRVARARLAQSSGGVVGLNTTALVNEGFLRLADSQGLVGRSRGQFFVYVGRVLRSVVIDHLRAESADKRGGGADLLTLSAAAHEPAVLSDTLDMLALDRALQQLQALDAGLYELLEMHTYAGLSALEVADLRGVSRRTVERDLLKARALLAELLGR